MPGSYCDGGQLHVMASSYSDHGQLLCWQTVTVIRAVTMMAGSYM